MSEFKPGDRVIHTSGDEGVVESFEVNSLFEPIVWVNWLTGPDKGWRLHTREENLKLLASKISVEDAVRALNDAGFIVQLTKKD